MFLTVFVAINVALVLVAGWLALAVYLDRKGR